MSCILTLFTIIGCSDSSGGRDAPEVVSITLEVTSEVSVPVGLNGRVIATATYNDDSVKNVSSEVNWVLDNENFTENGLTNDNEQRFKANPGSMGTETQIKAVMGTVESDVVTVMVSEATVMALKVTPPQATIPAGLSQKFYASAVLSDNRVLDVTSEEAVSWMMGEQTIEQGLVTPSHELVGQTLPISVSVNVEGQTFSDEAALNVSDLTVTRVEVQPADGAIWNTDLAIGSNREVVAIATMSNDTTQLIDNRDIIWSPTADSGHVKVEEVDNRAFVKGRMEGIGEVTATLKNTNTVGAFLFNIFEQLEPKAGIVGTEETLRKGASMQLKFVSQGSDGSIVDQTEGATWILDNTTYAHMEGNVLVATPQSGFDPNLDYSNAGTVTVTTTNGGTYEVELLDATATMLSISPSKDTTVDFGNNLQMEAFLTYSDGFQENVTESPSMKWEISDGASASFSKKKPGLLETVEAETMTVGGVFDGLNMAPNIKVTVNSKVPTSLSLSPASGYSAGLPQQLTVTMVYDDGTSERLAFNDEHLSVVVTDWDGEESKKPTVTSDGVFYASEPGRVTVTATKTFDSGLVPLITTEEFDVAPVKLISSLALSPKVAEVAAGQKQTFEVYSVDVDGKVTPLLPSQVTFMLDASVTGSTLDVSTGTVTAGSSAGDVMLTAMMKNVPLDDTVDGQVPIGSASIIVVEKALQSLEVQLPENLTLIPGQKVALSTLGRYNDDSAAVLSNDTVEWTLTTGSDAALRLIDTDYDGHVDTLEAVTSGSGSVRASYKDTPSIDDKSAVVTVNNASINGVVISPDIETLAVGFSQKFEAFAVVDTGDGMKLSEDQVSWTVTPEAAAQGIDNGDGTYTVQSLEEGRGVTVTASLVTEAFPNVNNIESPAVEMFTTVAADITSLLITPMDGSTVAVGVPYELKAAAVQNNGEVFDATDKVTWESDDSTVLIDESNKTVTFFEASNATVTLTATPNDASLSNYVTPATSMLTVLKPEVLGIVVTPPLVTLAEEQEVQLMAYEYYSYGKEPLDVTNSVDWSVEDVGDGELSVKVIGGLVSSSTHGGTVSITADKAGKVGSSSVFILEACGSQETDSKNIDDTDKSNAKEACLKVATDSSGKWFTSSPSEAVMEAMGYEKDSSETNSGDTYSRLREETGELGPLGGEFAEFRQDGNGVVKPGEGNNHNAGINGQFDRWCQKLRISNFAGRTDWRRPERDELVALRQKYAGFTNGLWDARGWPSFDQYLSSTVDEENESNYIVVDLKIGSTHSKAPSGKFYGSCVSNPQ
ncbi:surface protein Lk90-like protein [Vibrio sp. AND4]|nr:surface protein Lk90-like protein [Vibrio sp. AND4]